jgi:hypothetical protein
MAASPSLLNSGEPTIPIFDRWQRAFLAATAEYLSVRFKLPVPDWVHQPEFVLAEEWDRAATRADADPVYLKHGIVYNTRDLIRL